MKEQPHLPIDAETLHRNIVIAHGATTRMMADYLLHAMSVSVAEPARFGSGAPAVEFREAQPDDTVPRHALVFSADVGTDSWLVRAEAPYDYQTGDTRPRRGRRRRREHTTLRQPDFMRAGLALYVRNTGQDELFATVASRADYDNLSAVDLALRAHEQVQSLGVDLTPAFDLEHPVPAQITAYDPTNLLGAYSYEVMMRSRIPATVDTVLRQTGMMFR